MLERLKKAWDKFWFDVKVFMNMDVRVFDDPGTLTGTKLRPETRKMVQEAINRAKGNKVGGKIMYKSETKPLRNYLGFWRTLFAYFVRRELERNMGGRFYGRKGTCSQHDNRVITIKRNPEDTVHLFGTDVPIQSLLEYIKNRYDVEVHFVGGSRDNQVNIYFNREIR